MKLKAWAEGWDVPLALSKDGSTASFITNPDSFGDSKQIAFRQLKELDDFTVASSERLGRGYIKFELVDKRLLPQPPPKKKPLVPLIKLVERLERSPRWQGSSLSEKMALALVVVLKANNRKP